MKREEEKERGKGKLVPTSNSSSSITIRKVHFWDGKFDDDKKRSSSVNNNIGSNVSSIKNKRAQTPPSGSFSSSSSSSLHRSPSPLKSSNIPKLSLKANSTSKIENDSKTIEDLKRRVLDLELEIRKKDKAFKALQEEHETLLTDNEILRDQNKSLNQANSNQVSIAVEYNTLLKDLRESLKREEEEKLKLREELTKLKGQSETFVEEKAAWKRERTKLKEKIKLLVEENNTLKQTSEEIKASTPERVVSNSLSHGDLPHSQIANNYTHTSTVSNFDNKEMVFPEKITFLIEESMNNETKNRLKALNNLLISERDYLCELKVITEYYLKPIRETNKFHFELNGIFQNIESITSLHSSIFKTIEKQFKSVKRIDSKFLPISLFSIFSPLLDPKENRKYIVYCNGQQGALYVLEEGRKSSTFSKLLSQCSSSSPILKEIILDDLITKPAERFFSYLYLLKELVQLLHTDDPEKEYLNQFIYSFEQIISSLQNEMKDTMEKLYEIRNFLVEKDKFKLPFFHLGYYKQTGSLGLCHSVTELKASQIKERMCYLFERAFLIFKQKKDKKTYSLLHIIHLYDAVLYELSDEHFPNAFALLIGSTTKKLVFSTLPSNKKIWTAGIQLAIRQSVQWLSKYLDEKKLPKGWEGEKPKILDSPEKKIQRSDSFPLGYSSKEKEQVVIIQELINISNEDKIKYDRLFWAADVNKDGFIDGVEADTFFSHSLLSKETISQIRKLADLDHDSRLTKEEFRIAMHLVYYCLKGSSLPISLPPSLIRDATTATNNISTSNQVISSSSIGSSPAKDTFHLTTNSNSTSPHSKQNK